MLVAMLYRLGDVVRVLKKGNMIKLIEKEFENFLKIEGAKIYNSYSTFVGDYHLHALPKELADYKALHCQ